LGQGRENARQYLKDNPELALELENKIRQEFDLGNIKRESSDDETAE
jgi:recombination protein RecA